MGSTGRGCLLTLRSQLEDELEALKRALGLYFRVPPSDITAEFVGSLPKKEVRECLWGYQLASYPTLIWLMLPLE
jgi:hypothetical protein